MMTVAYPALHPAPALDGTCWKATDFDMTGIACHHEAMRTVAASDGIACPAATDPRYYSLFSNSKVVMLLIEPDSGAIVDANAVSAEYYGWDIETMRRMNVAEITVAPPQEISADLQQARREANGHFFARHRLRSGSIRYVEVHSGPVHIDERVLLLSVVHDITERKQAEERLRLAANVFIHARECITITDAEARIIDVNDAFCRTTGYTREEVLGQNPRMLSSGRQNREFYDEMWRRLREDGEWSGEIWNRRKNGEIYPEMLTISAVVDGAGVVTHYVALFTDIATLKQHAQELEHTAQHDPLTGLPNRLLLADRLGLALAQARRRSQLLAVLYIDLDGFKTVNDALGHHAGDELLVKLGRRMQHSLREEDTLARVGGDEFVAVLGGFSRLPDLEAVLDRLVEAAALPLTIAGRRLSVTASIGVAVFPLDESDADQLIRHADQALYQAKQSGKNRWTLFRQAEAVPFGVVPGCHGAV